MSLKTYIYADGIGQLGKRATQCSLTHLIRPSEASFLLPECIVVLLTDFVASLENDKTAVVITTGCQVHETLNATEAGTLGVC